MGNAINLGECLFTLFSALLAVGLIIRQWIRNPNMSSQEVAQNEMVDIPVQVPVPSTDTKPAGTDDITSVPVSRNLSDDDIIVLLAVQKRGGKPFSASAIYDLVKGNRASVLALVKEVRGGKETYDEMRKRIGLEVSSGN